ncbi:MAG: hypothetical protein RLZZ241_989 [Bacteroidota bacterium]|jgi:hypothetical protein
MKRIRIKFWLWLIALALTPIFIFAQPEPGVYLATQKTGAKNVQHLLLISDNYLIHSSYESNPAHFLGTSGGFYEMQEDNLIINLEFDSDYANLESTSFSWSYGYVEGNLILNGNEDLPYVQQSKVTQALDGQWLFATRGPDTGQERRGNQSPRKTLKFLMDSYFQWIAYNSETFEFFGTGGGRYAGLDGTYTEVIEFFSRDDSRVGAELNFEFERLGNDWHHKGLNSKGEPLYEIWGIRE